LFPAVTVTLKLHGAEDSPAWSVAVQVTVVVPIGNAESEGGLHVALAEQLSETVGANVATAAHVPKSGGLLMFPGQVICGGVESNVGVIVTSPTTPSSWCGDVCSPRFRW
jgi:hypothetical protein